MLCRGLSKGPEEEEVTPILRGVGGTGGQGEEASHPDFSEEDPDSKTTKCRKHLFRPRNV